LGQKSETDPSCQHYFLGHQQPQGHNKQESTTFMLPLPYGSNKQHCKESQWVFGVVQGRFLAKLGSKISDGSQLSAQFSWATNSHKDITNRNQTLLCFKQTCAKVLFSDWRLCNCSLERPTVPNRCFSS
jgi:hypothetical protein